MFIPYDTGDTVFMETMLNKPAIAEKLPKSQI